MKSTDGKSLFNVMLTAEERKLLQEISAQDDRDMANEIRWIIKAYAKGELLTKNEAAEKYTQLFESLRQLAAPSRRFDVSETLPPKLEDDALPEKQRRKKSQ